MDSSSAFVRGLQSAGVAACAKHFPGHGHTSVDSHLALPVIDASRSVLEGRELVPFVAAVEAGVAAVMTAHLVVPCLDDRPATLSSAVLTGLLRDSLGFGGAIVTDALDMAGVSAARGIPAAAVAALAAGADLCCLARFRPGRHRRGDRRHRHRRSRPATSPRPASATPPPAPPASAGRPWRRPIRDDRCRWASGSSGNGRWFDRPACFGTIGVLGGMSRPETALGSSAAVDRPEAGEADALIVSGRATSQDEVTVRNEPEQAAPCGFRISAR